MINLLKDEIILRSKQGLVSSLGELQFDCAKLYYILCSQPLLHLQIVPHKHALSITNQAMYV